MNRLFSTAIASLAGVFLLSACSTIGGVADTINPFDKTDADKRAEQGEVAGENERISLLSWNRSHATRFRA